MTTLDGRTTVVKEGWLTMYKSRKPTFFSSRPVPDKLVDRAWAVLHQYSNKGPLISFYQVCVCDSCVCVCVTGVCVCVVRECLFVSVFVWLHIRKVQ